MTIPAVRTGRMRTGTALFLLALSAIAFQRGATRAWLAAAAADGATIIVSPIGLMRVADAAAVSECRWWPRLGDPALCATSSDSAMAAVRRAYPLVIVALWTSVAALFLAVLAVPRRLPGLAAMVAAAASALAVAAIWSLGQAGGALSALAGSTMRWSGSGLVAVAGGAAMTTLAALLLLGASRGGNRA